MRTIAVVLGTLALLGAAACGGSSGPPAGSIKVTLNDYSFTPKDITAPAGSSTFYLVNEGKVAHDFTVQDSSGKTLGMSELIQPGNTSIFTIKLDAATYKVICTQPGHVDLGMVATLTVS
jgi:uncharacterized cupredoxin-like copper-binding protein